MTIEPEVLRTFFICAAVMLTSWVICIAVKQKNENRPRKGGEPFEWSDYYPSAFGKKKKGDD